MENENSRLRIVVIDDSDFSRRTTCEILRSHGYNVVGDAGTASQAFGLINTSGANLFIIDVVMPEVSGIDLAKSIAEKKSGAKVIMMSSLESENIVIESIGSGAIDFLQKPFEEEELLKSVGKVDQLI